LQSAWRGGRQRYVRHDSSDAAAWALVCLDFREQARERQAIRLGIRNKNLNEGVGLMKTKIIIGAMLLMCCFAFVVLGSTSSSPAGNKATGAAGKTVTISNFKFTPKNVTVKAGDMVTWTNKEGMHTVTADDGSFQSPNLAANKSYSHTFTRAGTYRYYCSFHGGAGGADMSGVVTVTK
jgi:plastocyanin